MQVLPVDLTRSIDSKTDVHTPSNGSGPRKLAFSVENILDPTKFTGRKENCDNDRNNNSQFPAGNGGGYTPGDDELSQAGECKGGGVLWADGGIFIKD